MSSTSTAWSDVLKERIRQQFIEGFDEAHDDGHTDGEMSRAAACYMMGAGWRWGKPMWWPWPESWWKPKDTRSDIVRGAALAIAEIERIDRAAAKLTVRR
jgi:hypothetical protein